MSADVPALATVEQARELTARIRSAAQNLTDAVTELRETVPLAHSSGAWRALGYTTWAAYCEAEIGAHLVRIGCDDRRVLVETLTSEGMSSRAIAAALGVARNTVKADQGGDGAGQIDPPVAPPNEDLPPADDLEGRTVEEVAQVHLASNPVEDAIDELLRADPELAAAFHDYQAKLDAARSLVRGGRCPPPPQWWQPVPDRAASTVGAARRDVRAERNRLGEWELDVCREAGRFLLWCERSGVDTATWSMPERMRYVLDDDDPPELPADWNAEDEHHAALGKLALWLGDTRGWSP